MPNKRLKFYREFIRRNLAAIVIWAASYIAIPLSRFTYLELNLFGNKTESFALAIAVFVSTTTYLIYRVMYEYLNRENDEQRTRKPLSESQHVFDQRYERSFESIEARLEALGAYVSNALKEAMARTAKQPTELFKSEAEINEFKASLAANIVLSATSNLKNEIVAELDSASKFKSADRYQSEIRERLYRVVRALERRANLNLAVGATIGGVGIGALIYLLYISPPSALTNSPDYMLLGRAGPANLDRTISGVSA